MILGMFHILLRYTFFYMPPPTPPPPLSPGVWGGNYEPLNTPRKKYLNCNIQSMYVITCLRKKSYEDV